jgi:hypothetical protein
MMAMTISSSTIVKPERFVRLFRHAVIVVAAMR